jgi:hypothetical protein
MLIYFFNLDQIITIDQDNCLRNFINFFNLHKFNCHSTGIGSLASPTKTY